LAAGTRSKEQGDPWLFLACFALVAIGLVMVYSATYAMAETEYGRPDFYVSRQLVAAALGLLCLFITSRMPMWVYANLSSLFLASAVVMLVLVLIPGIGVERGGARRWFDLGPILLQPSELAKLALVLYLASVGARRREDDADYRAFLWRSLGALGVVCLLIVVEPNLSTTLLVGATGLAVLFHAGLRPLHGAGVLIAAALAVAIVIPRHDYMQDRIQHAGLTQKSAVPTAERYQVDNGLIALGSGGIYGRGLTHSGQKFGFLPALQNDMILAIVGEELGFAGTATVLLLFGFIGWRGYRAAATMSDPFARLVAGGITTGIMLQAAINMGVVTDLLPTTGLPLPFISYGGSSLVMALAGIGVLLRASAESPDRQKEEVRVAGRSDGRRDRRALVPRAHHR